MFSKLIFNYEGIIRFCVVFLNFSVCFLACMFRIEFNCFCRFWVGYQYVITNRNHSLEGHWEVAYKGRPLQLLLS